jgi:hypothetical protein
VSPHLLTFYLCWCLDFLLPIKPHALQVVCTSQFFDFIKQTFLSLALLPACKLPSYTCLLSVFSLLPFSASQILYSKLKSFFAKVLPLFCSSIFAKLTHLQPSYFIFSNHHIYHKLIGTFLLSPSVFSHTLKQCQFSFLNMHLFFMPQSLNQLERRLWIRHTLNILPLAFVNISKGIFLLPLGNILASIL